MVDQVQSAGMQPTKQLLTRGAFIVFEGCDKCGKSTQSALLVDYLKSQNVPVKHMSFPDRQSASGMVINAYLTNKQELCDESIHLLFTANRWEANNRMNELLKTGTTLVVDRYSYSGLAYSTARGMNYDWCIAPERGLIRPDVVFYMATDVKTLSARKDFGGERFEKSELQMKIAQKYSEIYKTEQDYWKKIDASQMVEPIHKQVSSAAMKVIDDVKNKEIQILWT